jgi:peptidoglycan/LPS O-acetylase OafA/YrhL
MYRPQPFWMLKGTLLGVASGSLVASGLLITDVLTRTEHPDTAYIPEGVADAISLGVFFGGMLGAVTGLLVGFVMTFALGSHLHPEVERRRALVLGAVLPPLVLVAAASIVSGQPVTPGPVELVPLAASMFLGGLLARWAARFKPPRASHF